MPTHKSNDYKLTAVQYYLVEDKTQEEVCKIFKCTPRNVFENDLMMMMIIIIINKMFIMYEKI